MEGHVGICKTIDMSHEIHILWTDKTKIKLYQSKKVQLVEENKLICEWQLE